MKESYRLFGPFPLLFGTTPLLPTFENPVEAGFPSPAEDYLMKELDLNEYLLKPRESTFGFFVKGESMADVNIHTGDVVVVNTETERRMGQIVIAGINGDWAIKTLGKIEGKPYLLSQNPAYRPIAIKEFDDLQIFGVVKGFVHKFKDS